MTSLYYETHHQTLNTLSCKQRLVQEELSGKYSCENTSMRNEVEIYISVFILLSKSNVKRYA